LALPFLSWIAPFYVPGLMHLPMLMQRHCLLDHNPTEISHFADSAVVPVAA